MKSIVEYSQLCVKLACTHIHNNLFEMFYKKVRVFLKVCEDSPMQSQRTLRSYFIITLWKN